MNPMNQIPTQIKFPFSAILIQTDLALEILAEIETLRIAHQQTFDIKVASVSMVAVILTVSKYSDRIPENIDLIFHLNDLRDKTAAGYYRGSGIDWYFRVAQALVANAAGFPDRAAWSKFMPSPSI